MSSAVNAPATSARISRVTRSTRKVIGMVPWYGTPPSDAMLTERRLPRRAAAPYAGRMTATAIRTSPAAPAATRGEALRPPKLAAKKRGGHPRRG